MFVTILVNSVLFKLVKYDGDKFANKLQFQVIKSDIPKIISICKNNAAALIHSRDDSEQIRKFCVIKLKHKEMIKIFY
jgi:hypothetical protein